MNYSRLGLAALGGTVASFAVGFLVLWLVPALFDEARKYPAVFRPKEEMMSVMPIGLVASFIAILVVAIIFAMMHQGGSGTTEGARLGVLIGIFVVCASVLHNYVNLNIGLKLALGQAAAYLVQWTIVGIVIGLIYKPLATP
jgi:hypothetical protein